MKSTIIYLRTSTEEQSPENQLADCKDLCKKIGIDSYDIYEEKRSAWKDDNKRDKFNEILRLVKKGKLSNFVVWDLDRIYRNRRKQVSFFKLCQTFKCNIYSHRQPFLETFANVPEPWDEIMRDMLVQVMGWMAEEESKKRSDRVRAAYKNRKQKWGRKPLENVESTVIELHNQGKSIREIASEVHYWDKTRNKKFVSKSAVHKIIAKFRANSS